MILFAIVCLLRGTATLYVAQRGGLSNIARGRKYKSGTGWCAWRWTDVDSEYILRLHVFKTPWCAVCLHWIRKPDAEPWLHDHPVTFLSLILRGSYAEIRRRGDEPPRYKVHRWFNFVWARKTDRHRIVFCRADTLTLCFMGPKTREWGFHTPAGWLGWKDYYSQLRAGKNMRCEPWKPGPDGWLAEFNRAHNATLDAMTARANATLTGTSVDEDVRRIDTEPAAEWSADDESTDPYIRGGA